MFDAHFEKLISLKPELCSWPQQSFLEYMVCNAHPSCSGCFCMSIHKMLCNNSLCYSGKQACEELLHRGSLHVLHYHLVLCGSYIVLQWLHHWKVSPNSGICFD